MKYLETNHHVKVLLHISKHGIKKNGNLEGTTAYIGPCCSSTPASDGQLWLGWWSVVINMVVIVVVGAVIGGGHNGSR